MLRSHGWLFMSLTPDTRQPYLLLRSTCSTTCAQAPLNCMAMLHVYLYCTTVCSGTIHAACHYAHLQQLPHEVSHTDWEVGREGEAAMQYALVCLRCVLLIEGWIPRQHLVYQHTERPPVHGPAMALHISRLRFSLGNERHMTVLKNTNTSAETSTMPESHAAQHLIEYDLWCKIVRRPAQCVRALCWPKEFCETKVCDLQVSLGSQQKILRLHKHLTQLLCVCIHCLHKAAGKHTNSMAHLRSL